MAKKSLNITILFTFISVVLGANASLLATPVTYGLKELFDRAEKHPAFEKDFNALRRQAASKLSEVKMMRWLPTFNLSVIGGVVPDAKLDERDIYSYQTYDFESNNFDFSKLGGFWKLEVEAVQPIYAFGKISNYIEMAKKGGRLADLEKIKKFGELKLVIKKAYYTLQLANDSREILKEVTERLSEAGEKVEELLVKNAENVTETDRLKIRVFTADAKNRFLDAERANKLARSALEEICQLSGEWALDQNGLSAETASALTKDNVISASLRSPELQQLGEVIEMRKSEMAAVRANMFPTFFVAGKLEYSGAPGRTDIHNPFLKDDFNFFNIGAVLGMKQDLGIYRTVQKVDTLQAEVDRLAAQKEQLSAKTRLDAEKSYEEAVSAFQGIQINEDGFRAARSWLTSAGLSFNLGTSETKDVLESFAAYFKARVDLMKSLYTLNVALAELSETSGVEVLDRIP